MSRSESLRGEELRAALTDPHIGNKIVIVEETSSTNDRGVGDGAKGKSGWPCRFR